MRRHRILHYTPSEIALAIKLEQTDMQTVGAIYGYPKCCIKDFVDRVERNHTAKFFEHGRLGPWTGSGFIPCGKCAGRVRKLGFAVYVKQNIIPYRTAKEPFPIPARALVRAIQKEVKQLEAAGQ